MIQGATHRVVKKPQITVRYLADYMAASEQAKRTIVRKCRFQAIARVIQHDEAKMAVARFIRHGGDVSELHTVAQQLRSRLADSDFDRDLFEHNAEYIERFASVHGAMSMPDAEILAPGSAPAIEINGVKVTCEIHFRMRRVTKTNKVKVGAGALRYAKGKALPPDVAAWQSAILFGYLGITTTEDGAAPEHALCLTVDAYSGKAHPSPTDAVRRFQNVEAACASIAERWSNIAPPPGFIG